MIIPVVGGNYTFRVEEDETGLTATTPLVVAPSSGGTFPIVQFLNPVGEIVTSDDILDDIRQVLESSDSEPHPSLADRLSETVSRLETDHPTIAVGLREAIDVLKRL